MKKNRKIVLFMYAMGYFGISIFTQTTVKWYQYFYTPPETNVSGLKVLIPLSLIGITMIVARIFDGLADPVVAYLSDNCKSKRGRRIPFILFGSVPLAITFIMIWFPPVAGESIWNFIYLTIVLILFFIFFTVVVGPYLALIGEVSKTKEERIKLTTMQGITQVLGVMVAEAGSGLIIQKTNYRIMGITLGLIALATILLTPLFVKEEQTEYPEQQANIFSSIKMTMINRHFVMYLISYLMIWFGINTLTIAMPYITEILLRKTAETSGFLIAGAFVVAIVASPFIPKLTLKWGKKKVMLFASVALAIILCSMFFFGTAFTGWVPTFIIFLAGIPLSVTFIVPNAMVADIAEWDGLITGQWREGMYFGAQGLVIKIVIGFSSFITPLMFKAFGYSYENPLGLRLIGPLAGIVVLLGVMFLRHYDLSEDQLEQRRERHKQVKL
ncbi:MAG: MFS transporter [Clostridia bacterium]|nr:MFS transporter [Clostridia bacterium]